MKAGDQELARLAQTREWISEDVFRNVLAEVKRFQALGLEKSVEEILLESGMLSAEQVRSLRETLGLVLREERIGDYKIVRRIGVGGMGTVFEAYHVRLKQRIALKILLPSLSKDPLATERFIREARMLARLNHPHLVHAIDAGQDGDRYYLAMEYIEGENLFQMLLRAGPLNPVRSCEILREVCKALEFLEGKGLVHRDVKPANILVGTDGVVKLADLGLLLSPAASGGEPRQTCGTPHYVSPEQIKRKTELDVRSDLYSLAATWYYLLTGKPPFTGKSPREIMEGHLHRVPPAPSRLRPELPTSLDGVLLRWLSKDRDKRPASAKDALGEIEILLSALRNQPRKGWIGQYLVPALAITLISVLCFPFLRGPGQRRPGPPASPITQPGVTVATERVTVPDLPPSTPSLSPQPAVSRRLLPTKPDPVSREPISDPPLSSSPPPPPVPWSLMTPLQAVVQGGRSRVAELARSVSAALAPRLDEFRPLEPFCRSFHASSVAVEPRPFPGEVSLRYEFRSTTELLDFRSRQGSWGVWDDQLVGLAEPFSDPLWTLAWFEAPVSLEGELREAAAMIVGFEDLCVAPGRGLDVRVWREVESAPVPVLTVPVVPRGRWRVTFGKAGVELRVEGEALGVAKPLEPSRSLQPGVGRVFLKLAPSRTMEWLRIDGKLAFDWALERRSLLGTSR